MALGKSVLLFLADGTPGGLITAEIINWTGHVISAPRSDLPTLLKRDEVSRTGIYVLLGDDPEDLGGTIAYIGEADDVRKRLTTHARDESKGGKDFWVRAVVLTNKDMNLTKAHARYLESRFIALAAATGRVRLVNGTNPDPISLPEAARSDMEFFIEQAKIILPVLGVNLLRETTVATTSSPSATNSPVFQLSQSRDGVSGTAQEIDGEFTVKSGSIARRHWIGPNHSYGKLRDLLESDGSLTPTTDDKNMILSKDHVFASPSAAAAVLLGRISNGRIEWRVQSTGLSYGEWQQQGLDLLEQA